MKPYNPHTTIVLQKARHDCGFCYPRNCGEFSNLTLFKEQWVSEWWKKRLHPLRSRIVSSFLWSNASEPYLCLNIFSKRQHLMLTPREEKNPWTRPTRKALSMQNAHIFSKNKTFEANSQGLRTEGSVPYLFVKIFLGRYKIGHVKLRFLSIFRDFCN